MKILMVTEYFPPNIGGVEHVFETLANRFLKKGHQVEVITMSLPNVPPQEIKNGVTVSRVRVPRFFERYFFTFLSLPKLLKKANTTDLIQTTTLAAAFPAWIVSRILKKPCVLMVHEVMGERWSDYFPRSPLQARFYKLIESLIFRLPFEHYICVSSATRKDLQAHQSIPSRRIHVIHHGVELNDTPKAYSTKLEEFTYLYYGRPGISKGVEYLIRAVTIVRKQIPHSKLCLILSPKPVWRFKQMLKLIKDLGIGDSVDVLRPLPRNELFQLIKSSHGVVIPSLSEGFGFSAVEACALGMPVVVSQTTSLPEVAWGKVIFVQPGDPEDIARGVVDLYLGRWQNIPKKHFSWDKSSDAYLHVYRSLLTRHEKTHCSTH